MRRRTSWIPSILVGVVLGLLPPALAAASPVAPRAYAVRLSSPVAKTAGLADLLRPVVPATVWSKTTPGQRDALVPMREWFVLEGDDPAATARVALELAGHPAVRRVEPLWPQQTAAIPDDLQVGSQRFLGDVRALEAFDLVRTDGAVLIAIVDGGTDWRHEDLVANVWTNPGEIPDNGIDDDGNGFVDDLHGWNFADDTPDPTGLPATPQNARHGTHVAGIACARTNNGIGVSGASWNARFLPVNVSAAEPRGGREFLDWAYEGVLYAALMGADIINASWGRTGRWSDFEAAVIRAATEMGALVVGAAGNLVEPDYFFPAYYPEVLSVARLDPNGVVPVGSNRGTWVDLAAPGSFILGPFPGDAYGQLSGTSQAAAVVSGVAALVQTRHPEWTPAQLRQALRWTTGDIDEKNPDAHRQFGSGILDAVGAVTAEPPGVHVVDLRLVEQGGDGILEQAETASVQLTLRNELTEARDLVVRLVSDDPDLVLLEDTVLVPRLQGGASLEVLRNLELYVPFLADRARLSELVVEVTWQGRTFHQGLAVEALPLHVDVRGAGIEGSASLTGKLGYASLTRSGDPGGLGLRRPGQRSVILGGSLLLGDGPDRVSDGLSPAYPDSPYEDFRPPQFDAVTIPQPPLSAQHLTLRYGDTGARNPLGTQVTHHLFVGDAPDQGDFVLHAYDLTGLPADSRVGVLVDWELHDGRRESNRLHFDAERRLLHVSDGFDPEGPVAGLVLLDFPGRPSWSWMHDLAEEGQTQPARYDAADLSRKPSDEELWTLMTETAPDQGEDPGGVASVVAVGPVGGREGPVRFAFAMLVADDLESLRDQARRARVAYGSFGSVFGGVPSTARLLGNAPNPFNPRTEIRFTLPAASAVVVDLFDVRGRRVRRLLEANLPGGLHPIGWNGRDARGAPVASGVYHVLLRSDFGTDRLPVTLVR